MAETKSAFLTEALRTFRGYKTRTESAFSQLRAEDWFRLIDPEANSIASMAKSATGEINITEAIGRPACRAAAEMAIAPP